jgi:hypothetical protein
LFNLAADFPSFIVFLDLQGKEKEKIGWVAGGEVRLSERAYAFPARCTCSFNLTMIFILFFSFLLDPFFKNFEIIVSQSQLLSIYSFGTRPLKMR